MSHLPLTQEMVNEWIRHDKKRLVKAQTREMKRFEEKKRDLPLRDQLILDQAIACRYLVLPTKTGRTKRDDQLRWVYEDWCRANGQPTLIIGHAYNRVRVRVVLDLDGMKPLFGEWNIYRPDLDENDETFRLMMLLCNECSYSEGHVRLEAVLRDHAEEVAQQLLAFYDRMYQKRLREIMSFVADGQVL